MVGKVKRYSGKDTDQSLRQAKGKGETTGNIGKGHYRRGGSKHLIKDKRTGKSGAVRTITSISELNKIITEYEKKLKAKIARTPGAASAYRIGLKIGSGGGSGKY